MSAKNKRTKEKSLEGKHIKPQPSGVGQVWDVKEKNWIKERVIINDTCWEWKYCVGRDGYPKCTKRVGGIKKNIIVHRMSYQVFKGRIPNKYLVRHKCDNKLCVNPEHLEVGTQQDNLNDMVKRGRSLRGSLNNKTRLNEEDILYMRKVFNLFPMIKVKTLSEMFGVHLSTLQHILKYTTWGHI